MYQPVGSQDEARRALLGRGRHSSQEHLLFTLPKRLRKPQGEKPEPRHGSRSLFHPPLPGTGHCPLSSSPVSTAAETCRSSLQPVSELSLLGLCPLPSWRMFPFLLLLAEGCTVREGQMSTSCLGFWGVYLQIALDTEKPPESRS